MKKVSIILPVYNSEKTISNTIESILKQTYQYFELIIINDGSIDNTDLICRKYLSDTRIKYIKNNNQGVSASRNCGIEIASGEKICFIDSDDEYLRDFLEVMIEKYENELIVCGYNMIGKNNIKKISIQNFISKEKNIVFEKLHSSLLFNQVWNKMFDTKIIKKNGIRFDESISIAEDLKFVIDYLFCCDNICFCNECLYNYKISFTGLGLSFRTDANDIKIELLEKIEKKYIESKYDLEYIYINYIKQMYASIANLLDSRNDKPFKIKKEAIKKFLNKSNYKKIIHKTLEVKNIKYKVLSFILNTNNIYIIIFWGKIANIYDKINKKSLENK